MTFERRRSPTLAFHCYAPDAPNDITSSQVRDFLAVHPEFKVVRLSGGLMNRPTPVQDEWRKLDDELCEAGLDVYFTVGGTCTWEAGFSDGKPPGPARRPFAPTLAAATPLEGITSAPVDTSTHGSTPDGAALPRGDNPPTVRCLGCQGVRKRRLRVRWSPQPGRREGLRKLL